MVGWITTGVLVVIVGGIFLIGVRKIIRKFTNGESDCCTSSACGSCQCHCQKEQEVKE